MFRWLKLLVKKVKNWRKPSRFIAVTLREVGSEPIIRKVRRPGKRWARQTAVGDILARWGKYHGQKNPVTVFVNNKEAKLTDPVPAGADVKVISSIA